jgi:patatin-related protein
MSNTEASPGIRELRLALVCYGGVSLAVYMHGVTKELRKLVVASRAFEQQPDHNPFADEQTEWAYFEQLAALAVHGTTIRVLIDVISGTSAGGINGVCLAKALASDGSDEQLRDLWLSRGDIAGLVNAPRWLPLAGRVTYAVGRLASRPTAPYTPLRGDDMARWLYDAIGGMSTPDKSMTDASVRGLFPAGLSLRLFVTTTDLTGYERIVESGAGEAAQHDRSYGHVLRYLHEAGGSSDFSPSGTAALALAARCTSSFPGAFPPVRLKDFANDLSKQAPPGGRPCDLDGIVKRFFPQYLDASGEASAQVWATAFVDGGVLDNAPFDHAIEAIVAQRAETEVIRQLIYIEPDPGRAPAAGTASAQPAAPLDPVGPPGWLSTVWRVRTTIPWHQPLLAQLLDLRDLNARIRDLSLGFSCGA